MRRPRGRTKGAALITPLWRHGDDPLGQRADERRPAARRPDRSPSRGRAATGERVTSFVYAASADEHISHRRRNLPGASGEVRWETWSAVDRLHRQKCLMAFHESSSFGGVADGWMPSEGRRDAVQGCSVR
jgi:hypothetical protein